MFALAPNQLPSNSVAVAAVVGIDQESSNRMLAKRLKKIPCTWACTERPSASGRAFIKRMQNRVLLFCSQAGEFGSVREHLTHSCVQFGQSFAVCLLVVDSKRDQPMIDE